MEADDQGLVAAYRAGNAMAFEHLVERHLGPVRHYILRLTGDREVANDLAQETFVKVWQALDRYDLTQRFTPWLYTIARRTVIDWSRKRRPVLFSALATPADETPEARLPDTETPLPDAIFAATERRRHIETALDALPPHYREVLILHHLEQLSFTEIAAMKNVPVHTVKSQGRRGGQLLAASLAQKMHQTGEDLRI